MRDHEPTQTVYGLPPSGLVAVDAGAVQVSPLRPGGVALESFAEGSLSSAVIYAPPGSMERRYQLALTLRALQPGARLTALAPNDKGGARLRKELEHFGCVVEETARQHHRICTCDRPDTLTDVAQALNDGAPRVVETFGLWSQPGVFSWDRIDPGSALLMQALPAMSGVGADLGCGVGHLALAVLRSPAVEAMTLIDIDRRAIEAARRNVADARAHLVWGDATAVDGVAAPASTRLDFVVSNPPFHDGGAEDRALGQAFIRCAAARLRKGGAFWMVANRHLPYEAVLRSCFARVDLRAEHGGFKVFEART